MKRLLIVLALVFLLVAADASADVGLATQNYRRLWKEARPFLPGQRHAKAPALTPVPKGGGDAYVNYPNGVPQRAVNEAPQTRRQLKLKPNTQRFTQAHEWAHILGAGSEGHANRVANLVIRGERGRVPRQQVIRRIRHTLNIADG